MADPAALVRVLNELVWRLRREGLDISAAQAIDVVRAVAVVGLERRRDVRDAVAGVVVHRSRDRPRFDAAFDSFFERSAAGEHGSLWDRLRAAGFDDAELDVLRALMAEVSAVDAESVASLGALLDRGADFDRQLATSGITRLIDAHSGMQVGFRTHQLLGRLGANKARLVLAALGARLREALGARGDALVRALEQELERADDAARLFVRRTYEARVADLERRGAARRIDAVPFVALSDVEIDQVRAAVRRFAERLRGGHRVRARRAQRGRVDPHRTLRQAMRTGGVPFALSRKKRVKDRPKIVLLCDVSDSVRAAASFLLEFVHAAQELFDRTRSFVFVSDLGETTELFAREPPRVAIERAWLGGGVVRAGENSNYGRALRAFEAHHLREVDRRTTVIVLGDGRTNHHDAAPEVLGRIRAVARALFWFCPEPRGKWSEGDSAMWRYEPHCTAVYEVCCARDFENAALKVGRFSSAPGT